MNALIAVSPPFQARYATKHTEGQRSARGHLRSPETTLVLETMMVSNVVAGPR